MGVHQRLRKRHLLVEGADHGDSFGGRRWREHVCARARAFIATAAGRASYLPVT